MMDHGAREGGIEDHGASREGEVKDYGAPYGILLGLE